MFGYVTANEQELKVREYKKYKSYYCGLCHCLKKKYGVAGQMTLTYDMTFLIMLLTSLYESETEKKEFRCMVHPVKKVEILQNEITEYAADMNLILAYYHLKDDWEDEKKATALAGTTFLKRKVERAVERYERQAAAIRKELSLLSEFERAESAAIDEVAGCFGRLMGELFVYKEDCWEPFLRKAGFYLGKFIYIMDAYEDLPEDIEKGNFNPLRKMSEDEMYEDNCKDILCMMMGECAAAFEKLPCVLDIDILRNILYDGVWKKYQKLQNKKSEE